MTEIRKSGTMKTATGRKKRGKETRMSLWREIEKELESSRLYRTAKNVGEYIDEQINTQLHADQQGGRSAPPSGGQGSNAANAGNRRVYETKYGEPAGESVPPPPPSYAPPVYDVKARPAKRKGKEEPPEGMRAERKKSPAPFYTAGMIWVAYACLFPLYAWYHFLIAAALSLLFGWLASKIFKGKVIFVPLEAEPEPAEEEETPSVRTGDPEVDRMIAEGYDYLRQLRVANDAIEDEMLSEQMDRMEETCEKIFDFVSENPQKAGQIRRFMNYYLPVTLKLLTSYYKMSRQGIEGENISTTMFHIEGMMHTIVIAFEKQLDALFQDEALDISTDITVLEGMLKQEGLMDDTIGKKEENHGRD